MCCPMEVRVSCCSCLVHEAGPAPGSSNVRPALATVRVSGPSIKRGVVRDPDGRERPPINPATPASTTSSYPDRGTQDLRPITTEFGLVRDASNTTQNPAAAAYGSLLSQGRQIGLLRGFPLLSALINHGPWLTGSPPS